MVTKKRSTTADVAAESIEEQATAPAFTLPDQPPPVLIDPQPAPTFVPAEEQERPHPFAYSDIKDIIRLPIGFQCSVKFDAWDDYVTFLARADDIEEHGRAIYAACASMKAAKVPNYFPTDAELLEAVQERLSRELRRANVEVTKYQDRVDVDDASAADVALLRAWKIYRVGLNRLPDQEGFPHCLTWPVAPDTPAI
ncbi:virus tail fiber assembly protein lambda gpK [Collimonas sp. PA-H2]|uniref:tail fiber assembly protein n=1 Tax=Collimonas sp. PA-H2 TaxID=1881062 RepID=UPI000BF857A6|nr:tail fiber assembly protein [Collimonas sp. PA-H2]PFH10988.1 virus tail fiber assembly protein lambda gpK [Collimonas sp. PA-H2]